MSMENNTEVTTTPEATSTPTGWSALSKNTKIVLGVVAVIIILAIAGGSGSGGNSSSTSTPDTSYTPTTQNVSDAYYSWKSSFSPIFATMMTDYQQTVTDLTNGDIASSRIDFASLSQDAIDMSANADSPDARLNAVIQQLSIDLGVLAGEGTQSLNNIEMGGSPTAGFSTACDAISNDISALNNALDSANATY